MTVSVRNLPSSAVVPLWLCYKHLSDNNPLTYSFDYGVQYFVVSVLFVLLEKLLDLKLVLYVLTVPFVVLAVAGNILEWAADVVFN